MCRPTWTGTATSVGRPGEQARKIFVFDSIADEMAVEQAVHKSATEFGGIDIIINNAGTVAPDDSVSAANGLLKTAKPPRTSSSITVTRDVSIESRWIS
jgi:NAD(P)-dependent dehydrogenase (short-subunit alcohol dehydrogenase family)